MVCTCALAHVHLPGYMNDAVELCKCSVVRGNVFKLVFFFPTVACFFDRREREIRIES